MLFRSRFVGADEGLELNQRYRDRGYPTNVLSFAADLPHGLSLPLLGDVVICAPVVEAEAREQGKSATAHYAHMVVHGTLHLLGYDHESEDDAQQMEQLEISALAALGVPNPYESPSS